ncbi:MAG: hypothetical protein KJ822_06225, partial [Proteobacteria bacterium]|nr:hypothetical protein [Pseudomonadota bacterium]
MTLAFTIGSLILVSRGPTKNSEELAIILSSPRFQKVEGMICIAKPFKMIFRSGDIAALATSAPAFRTDLLFKMGAGFPCLARRLCVYVPPPFLWHTTTNQCWPGGLRSQTNDTWSATVGYALSLKLIDFVNYLCVYGQKVMIGSVKGSPSAYWGQR